QLLANGSVSMATVWSDQSLQALNNGVLPPTIKVTQFQDLPMPGGYAPWSVPKNAKNLQGALDFINFMLTPDEQVSVVKDIGGFHALLMATAAATATTAQPLPRAKSKDWSGLLGYVLIAPPVLIMLLLIFYPALAAIVDTLFLPDPQTGRVGFTLQEYIDFFQ